MVSPSVPAAHAKVTPMTSSSGTVVTRGHPPSQDDVQRLCKGVRQEGGSPSRLPAVSGLAGKSAEETVSPGLRGPSEAGGIFQTQPSAQRRVPAPELPADGVSASRGREARGWRTGGDRLTAWRAGPASVTGASVPQDTWRPRFLRSMAQ